MAADAKKRTTLTFAAKLEAIQRVENGEKSSVADGLGIPRSTLSTLLKNKADIKAKAEKSQHAGFGGRTDEASVEESEEAGLACADEESELAETWSKLESFVGAEPQSMCIEDFVGGDDSTGTTAELTDVEIVAEATAEQPNEDAAEVDPASADGAPLPTSAEVVAALALARRHCSAIEGTGLSLVDRLDYVEDAVVKHAIANKKQATLFQYFKPTQ